VQLHYHICGIDVANDEVASLARGAEGRLAEGDGAQLVEFELELPVAQAAWTQPR